MLGLIMGYGVVGVWLGCYCVVSSNTLAICVVLCVLCEFQKNKKIEENKVSCGVVSVVLSNC